MLGTGLARAGLAVAQQRSVFAFNPGKVGAGGGQRAGGGIAGGLHGGLARGLFDQIGAGGAERLFGGGQLALRGGQRRVGIAFAREGGTLFCQPRGFAAQPGAPGVGAG